MDMSNIGQGRAFPNPNDAVEAQTGRYVDVVDAMTAEQKLPMASFPMAPAPMPFASVRRTSGGR
jgi:hypothetical protein